MIQNINNTPQDSGQGDNLYVATTKINDNFDYIQGILNDVLTTGSTISISQVSGLQAALNNINNELANIPIILQDIVDINTAITSINNTLNSQNISITELLADVVDLQSQINLKVDEAPIDGQQYARQNGSWTVVTGGSGGAFLPLSGGTMYSAATINFINNTKIGEGLIDAGTGGNKGIALTCAVGYEWKWEAGEAYLTNLSGNIVELKQYARTIPLENDDVTKGFASGSYWSVLGGQIYQCQDATEGAAVWVQVTNFGNLQNVTDNGNTTTNSITADGGFTSTWVDGSFQAGPGFFQYSEQQIVDDEERSVSTSIDAENGFSSSFTNNTTQLNSFITHRNDVTLAVNQTIDSVFVNNYLTVTPTQTETIKKIITNEGFEGNYVKFNTGNTETSAVGKMYWNDTDGTLDIGLKGGNVTLQVGQETVIRVVNKTATNIDLLESNYQAVRLTGAQGQRLKVDLALATNDLNSAETIGLVTETILNNQEGFITTSGLIRGINTTGSLQGETWADGDILYLSPTVAGRITKVKPSAPNHLVIIGYVVRAHITQGTIFVKVDNGYELDELHNVNISAATNNDILTYNSSLDVWQNKQLPVSNSGTTGLISSTDWNTFNNKQTDLWTFQRTQGVYFFEDFLGQNDNSAISASIGVTMGSTGTGAANRFTGIFPNRTNQSGVVQLALGTTSGGTGSIRFGSNNTPNLYLGIGILTYETYINIETLSTGTERYIWGDGLVATSNYLSSPQGVYFIYDEGGAYISNPYGASPNFKAVSTGAIGRTITNTNIAVTAGAWVKLRIEINADASQHMFYINDSLVATHTNNLVATTIPLFIANWFNKIIGVTSRSVFKDYLAFRYIFTNPR